MSRRWTEAEVAHLLKAPLSAAAVGRRSSAAAAKYRNERCVWRGLKFASLREMEHYKEFKLEEAAGTIRAVIRQVSLPLKDSMRRIVVDFLIILNDGGYRWKDSKGKETTEWRGKRDQVRTQYGIDIELI